MPRLKNRHKSSNAQLGLPEKGQAIEELVVGGTFYKKNHAQGKIGPEIMAYLVLAGYQLHVFTLV